MRQDAQDLFNFLGGQEHLETSRDRTCGKTRLFGFLKDNKDEKYKKKVKNCEACLKKSPQPQNLQNI